jgi:hypothetical protein
MSTQAQDLINRAANVLNDAGYTRWTNAEMFLWLTDGEREAVTINPSVYTKRATVTLAAGAVQTLSISDYNRLIEVTRNMAADGVTPGQIIFSIDSRLQAALDPLWETATQSGTIQQYMYEPDDRYVIRVSPPAVAGTKIELIYSAIPPAIASMTDTIVLPDVAGPALVDYILFRAFSKDAEFGDVPQMASGYHQLFEDAISKI